MMTKNRIRIECVTCGIRLDEDAISETYDTRLTEFWDAHRAHTRRVTTDDPKNHTQTVEDFIPRSRTFPMGAYATIHRPLPSVEG